MSVSSLGFGSGLPLQELLDGLMKVEATQQSKLKSRVTARQSQVSVYQQLNTRFLAVKTASEALNLGSSWKVNKAISSDPSVTASASSSAISGSFSFAVSQMASAHVLASSQTVSLDDIVATGTGVIGNFGPLGISTASASGGLAVGNHTINVTQAATSATLAGTPVAASTIIDSSNNTISMNVNGQVRTLTLAEGTYDRQGLAQAITTASNGELSATLAADNSVSIATVRQGSGATAQITGGTALGAIGQSAGAAVAGGDGIIEVDGVTNTVTNTEGSVALNSTTGALNVTFSGSGMTNGQADFDVVDYGDGKLSTVVNNINAANGPFAAAAIQVSPGQYKLQLSAKDTGVNNAITINRDAFASMGLGTLQDVSVAKDAILQVGDGAGAYTITSASNSIKDALPGVTIDITKADPAKTITVGVSGDVATLSTKVEAMVKAANDAMQYIRSNSTYTGGVAGPLLGNSAATQLQRSLFSESLNPVVGTELQGLSAVGIKSGPNGTITFDKAAFEAAYLADPEAVAEMFVNGGTSNVQDPAKGKGLAERLADLAKSATNSIDGTITTAIKGANRNIEDLNKQIEVWDLRLERRRETLQRQFTALDVAVASSQSMSNWLSGQISSLQTNSAR